MSDTISLTVEFTGGLESAFNQIQKHDVKVPAKDSQGENVNIKFLIRWLCDNLLGEDGRKDIFVLEAEDERLAIRPGILVLINDADWELEGEDLYELQHGDNVMFVSTLHGG